MIEQECVEKLKDGRLKLSESLFSPVPPSAFWSLRQKIEISSIIYGLLGYINGMAPKMIPRKFRVFIPSFERFRFLFWASKSWDRQVGWLFGFTWTFTNPKMTFLVASTTVFFWFFTSRWNKKPLRSWPASVCAWMILLKWRDSTMVAWRGNKSLITCRISHWIPQCFGLGPSYIFSNIAKESDDFANLVKGASNPVVWPAFPRKIHHFHKILVGLLIWRDALISIIWHSIILW